MSDERILPDTAEPDAPRHADAAQPKPTNGGDNGRHPANPVPVGPGDPSPSAPTTSTAGGRSRPAFNGRRTARCRRSGT